MQNPHAEKLIELLKENGVDDQSVLDAIYTLPREHFVSQAMLHQAYDNNALPIGHGQTISQPYIVARMTQLLNLRHSSRVLEIGTGSGYQTAVLAQLVEHVYSIERIKILQWEAKRRLRQLDIYNFSLKHGDGWQGWAAKAPFDAIIVTAAASKVPQALLEQLTDGGRLVIPVGEDNQQLLCVKRVGDAFETQTVEAVKFVPLVSGDLA
ncbi:protein-L-isoaspartate(D-aspartate) O-methyltransferase [Vibrio salinus]|uniref:protein-L-isoaspartate(D-aspartate) O-methyltransferase n=1 Tax=Vibrio salinus TaxID=2899784 RepID=UPI001E398E6A|nr:protein-L-isoaspartate(D-aspartate) O-methyltransferase [Vibrio salinus]MCE0494203.1 protein-L-isoaspartate(D-aspartate) O-methyltransferase [Vibrio salinus]